MFNDKRSILIVICFILCCFTTVGQVKYGKEGRGLLETIDSTYSNLRGLNYILTSPNHEIHNSASQWVFYDSVQVRKELQFIKRLGANAVRVWGSYQVYKDEEETYLIKLKNFFDICEQEGLYVQLILFDGFGVEPEDSIFGRWHQSPGSILINDQDFADTDGPEYVSAVVSTLHDHNALLMYDLMNEPRRSYVLNFLTPYYFLIKSIDDVTPLTIGHFQASDCLQTDDIVDVYGYHPYGILPEIIPHENCKVLGIGTNKPIIPSEVGRPGTGESYCDVMASLKREGLGFFLFDAIIGDHEFNMKQGFLYPDGTARDTNETKAFQALAKEQGIITNFNFIQKELNDPMWIDQSPVGLGIDREEAANIVNTWVVGSGDTSRLYEYTYLTFNIWDNLYRLDSVTENEYLHWRQVRQRFENYTLFSGFLNSIGDSISANQNYIKALSSLDSTMLMTSKVLEEKSSNLFNVYRYGSPSVHNFEDSVWLTAYEIEDLEKVRLVGYNFEPGEVAIIFVGLQQQNLSLNGAGIGSWQWNYYVDDLYLTEFVVADEGGCATYDLDVSTFHELQNLTSFSLSAQMVKSSNDSLKASNGLRIDLLPVDLSVGFSSKCVINTNNYEGVEGGNEIDDSKILFFPNPMHDKLEVVNYEDNYTFTLFNVNGIKVMEVNSAGKRLTIQKENLMSGIYFAKLSNEHKFFKILVKGD